MIVEQDLTVIEQDLFAVLIHVSGELYQLRLQADIFEVKPYKVVKEYPHEFTIQKPQPTIMVAEGGRNGLLKFCHATFNLPLELAAWPSRDGIHNPSGKSSWHYRMTNFHRSYTTVPDSG